VPHSISGRSDSMTSTYGPNPNALRNCATCIAIP
jgi:hypothetical protein